MEDHVKSIVEALQVVLEQHQKEPKQVRMVFRWVFSSPLRAPFGCRKP